MGLNLWFTGKKRSRWAVDKLHQAIMNQALRPEFYAEGFVRDTFSGRFELASLHAALVFRRLREMGPNGRALAQECFDELFVGFDEALRDVGTGDLTVGKKIRKLGEAFYGRARAYDEALAEAAPAEALRDALIRNLSLSEGAAPGFVRYVTTAAVRLSRHRDDDLLRGEMTWPKPLLSS
jgi:cytochrome b pre-mRNA-processing protein 3